MAEIEESEEDQLTRIVSYLDGELSDAETVQIEKQLLSDPELRERAEKLSRTWSMLDDLDEVSASLQFTKQTMTSVVAESTASPSRRRPGRWRAFARALSKHRIIPYFLAGLIGGSVGLLTNPRGPDAQPRGPRAEQRVERILLNDFELLKNYARYASVPSLEALQTLDFPPNTPATSGEMP